MKDIKEAIREFEEERKRDLAVMKEKVRKLNEKYLSKRCCAEDLFYEISDMWFLLRNTTIENGKIYGTVVKVSNKEAVVMKILKKRDKMDDRVIRTQCEVPEKYKHLINKVMTCSEIKDNIDEQDLTDGLWVAFTDYKNSKLNSDYSPSFGGRILNITKYRTPREFDIRWEMTLNLNKQIKFQFIANNDEAHRRCYIDGGRFI